MGKTAVIGYKKQIENGLLPQLSFKEIKPCCKEFHNFFKNVAYIPEEHPFFWKASDDIAILLETRVERTYSHKQVPRLYFKSFNSKSVLRFCPFCRAQVKLKRVRFIERIGRAERVIEERTL